MDDLHRQKKVRLSRVCECVHYIIPNTDDIIRTMRGNWRSCRRHWSSREPREWLQRPWTKSCVSRHRTLNHVFGAETIEQLCCMQYCSLSPQPCNAICFVVYRDKALSVAFNISRLVSHNRCIIYEISSLTTLTVAIFPKRLRSRDMA